MYLMQAICDTFLQDHLSPSNCIGVWKHASGHGMKELSDISWKAIMKNFPDVVSGDEFLLLEKADVICLIEGKDLFTPNEEFVCDAVLKWYRHNAEKRRSDLGEIFQHLRFVLMDLDYLCNVRDSNDIEDVKECRSIVLKAIEEVNKAESAPSSLYREEEVLCMVGTRSREPNPQKTEVQCFSARHGKKFKSLLYRRNPDRAWLCAPWVGMSSCQGGITRRICCSISTLRRTAGVSTTV